MHARHPETNEASWLGYVKWFDKVRGYGFVTVSEHSEDILLHISTLRNFGVTTLFPGTSIEFEASEKDGRTRVSEILSITQPKDLMEADGANSINAKWEPVKVKWYNPDAGYGFVNRFHDSDDVFIGATVLRSIGLSCLKPDEALSAQIVGEGKETRVQTIGFW